VKRGRQSPPDTPLTRAAVVTAVAALVAPFVVAEGGSPTVLFIAAAALTVGGVAFLRRDRLHDGEDLFRRLLPRVRGRWRSPIARGRRRSGPEVVDRPMVDGDWLIGVLLRSALEQLPVEVRERWAEEWVEHSAHRSGWRLVWWAACVRATAVRTGREYRRARLPLGG
jgi:hypothetical protein